MCHYPIKFGGHKVQRSNRQKFPPEESKETNNESKMTTLNNCEISRLNYTRFEFEIVMFYFLCRSLSNSRRHSANAEVKNEIIVSRRHFFTDMTFSATSKV